MNKLRLILLLTFFSSVVYAQHDFFVFKKKNKTMALFSKDSYIAFQVKGGQWFTGNITRIHDDSFYIRPMIVHYNMMGTDTVHYAALPFTFADVFAMPKKGVKVDYINGRFQIAMSAGHIHWYWVKSGWVFMAGAAGYALLDVVNGLIQDDLSFSGTKLGIAAAVFLFGELLHHTYKLTLRLGKKYHLESINLHS